MKPKSELSQERYQTLGRLQRHMPGLKNIPSGTEPRKDLLKALRRKKG